MTSLEALLAAEAEQHEAEARALMSLATFLRTDAIAELPTHSPVARAFVQYAKAFEMWAGGPGEHRGTWTTLSLNGMLGDIVKSTTVDDEDA
jgi:hypothetical protein